MACDAQQTKIVLEHMQKQFSFDESTGVFTRIFGRYAKLKKSIAIGSLDKGGYLKTAIKGKGYLVHRLVWLYVYGSWPIDQLDHINGRRTDNRPVNLREATCAQNHGNRRMAFSNTSGFKGVTRHKTGKWQAAIWAKGKFIYLGLYVTPQEGHAAYMTAAKKHFGDFASSGEIL